MRIIFMGSAELAIPALQAIVQSSDDQVVGVVTQPDRPAGRKRQLTPCPLKAFAEQAGLPIMTPEKVGSPESVAALTELRPDLFVVVAYGQYIPTRVIELAPHKAINLHPSLLPKYRGSAPIQWAIANGDSETGVSIIRVAQKMDAGDILRQEHFPIDPDDTSQTLHQKLAEFGATLLLKTLDDIRAGTLSPIVQDESQVVEIRKLTKEDGAIDWTQPASTIRNRIRAFDPWPGSHCKLPDGTPLKVWKAEIISATGTPSELLDDALLVATGNNALRLTEIQPLGKKRMPARDFLNGHPQQKGMFLTT
jgi:methionyl-tRNA formyltransferase